MNNSYLHSDPNPEEEQKLEPERQNFSDSMRHLSEKAATGAPKVSLLRALAEEALAKGNPVLVIPLDGASASEDETPQEPSHDLRLPRNTTVIFTGEEGFPVTAATGSAKVRTVSGDLGAEAAKRAAKQAADHEIPDRAQGIRVVDPFDASTLQYSPFLVDQADQEASDAPEENR